MRELLIKQDNIKQSGFRTLTDNEIEAVSGGFGRGNDGSETSSSNGSPGFSDIVGTIIDFVVDSIVGPSDEDKINSAALEAHVDNRGTDEDGNKYIQTNDGFTFTDTDGNGFYDTQSKVGPNGTIYSTTDGDNWIRQYYIGVGLETHINFN